MGQGGDVRVQRRDRRDTSTPIYPSDIATFANYAEVESAVDYLSGQLFLGRQTTIVGRDIELVEQVVGRLNYRWAACRGAIVGSLTATLFSWNFGLLDWVRPPLTGLTLAFYVLIFGAVVGALLGLLTYALQGASVTSPRFSPYNYVLTQPRNSEVLADVEVADQAVRRLTGRTNRKE
ncbi:general stress protein [Rhodococcus rhodochrous]|uniref:general stress protein n=1 Tax=Rhodococcus rhodochrous TaxID=1829 RepID=UPI0027E3AC6B|nr:general stress protein [Rhodococcus rhodochrous]